jgi:hypothetical protein
MPYFVGRNFERFGAQIWQICSVQKKEKNSNIKLAIIFLKLSVKDMFYLLKMLSVLAK